MILAVIVFCHSEQLAMALIRFLISQLSSGIYALPDFIRTSPFTEIKRKIQGFAFVKTIFAYLYAFLLNDIFNDL